MRYKAFFTSSMAVVTLETSDFAVLTSAESAVPFLRQISAPMKIPMRPETRAV